MVKDNKSCGYQWTQPMGAVYSNGHSQWELYFPMVTANGSSVTEHITVGARTSRTLSYNIYMP